LRVERVSLKYKTPMSTPKVIFTTLNITTPLERVSYFKEYAQKAELMAYTTRPPTRRYPFHTKDHFSKRASAKLSTRAATITKAKKIRSNFGDMETYYHGS
jgi:hypothetical protein